MPKRSEKKVMVCTRLNSLLLVLGLLLSSAFIGDCSAEAHHGIAAFANNDQTIKGDSKELLVTRRKWLRGRKLGVENVKKEVMEAKGTFKKGADPSIGKCNHSENGKLNLECELRSRSIPSSVKKVGLIPFSSDYHFPKTHPPKNN